MSKAAKLHKQFVQGKITAKGAIREALAHGKKSERARILAIVDDFYRHDFAKPAGNALKTLIQEDTQ